MSRRKAISILDVTKMAAYESAEEFVRYKFYIYGTTKDANIL